MKSHPETLIAYERAIKIAKEEAIKDRELINQLGLNQSQVVMNKVQDYFESINNRFDNVAYDEALEELK